MTYAPECIKAARELLITHLDYHPGSTGYVNDLDPAEVGIVGDVAHAASGTSYHLGKSQLRAGSYSVVESLRDKRGLTDAAAALDIGEFRVSVGAKFHTLRTFSAWLVVQCSMGAPDTADIREVIYSLDGQTVKRWDRLKKRTSGPSSHRTHTHISYFRDSEGRDKTALFRRYLTEIGLLEDDMTPDQLVAALNSKDGQAALRLAAGVGVHNQKLGHSDITIGVALQNLLGLDPDEIAARVLAGLPPSAIASAIPTGIATEVANLLAARLAA
jgi:hypothetical protein